MTILIRPWRPQGHFLRPPATKIKLRRERNMEPQRRLDQADKRVAAYEVELGLGRANTDRDA